MNLLTGDYIGEPGQRIGLEAVYVRRVGDVSDIRGPRFTYYMRTATGNSLKWEHAGECQKWLEDSESTGQPVSMTVTIKGHKPYGGERLTIVQRVASGLPKETKRASRKRANGKSDVPHAWGLDQAGQETIRQTENPAPSNATGHHPRSN